VLPDCRKGNAARLSSLPLQGELHPLWPLPLQGGHRIPVVPAGCRRLSRRSSSDLVLDAVLRGSPWRTLEGQRLGLLLLPWRGAGDGRHGWGRGQVRWWCAGDGLGSAEVGGEAERPGWRSGEEEGESLAPPKAAGPWTRAWRMASATGAPWPLRGHGGRVYLRPVPRAPSAVFRAENGSGQLCCSRVQHGCTRGQRGCTGRRQSAGRSVRLRRARTLRRARARR